MYDGEEETMENEGNEEDFYGEDYNGYNQEPESLEPVVNNQDEIKVIKIDEKYT